jgi:hypothetical protein
VTDWFGRPVLFVAHVDHSVDFYVNQLGFTHSWQYEGGKLVRLMPGFRVTNSTFDEGIYATFLQSSYPPEKMRVFVDCMAENVPRQLKRAK